MPANLTGRKSWEQLPHEDAKYYQAFQCYLKCPPRFRSIAKAARIYMDGLENALPMDGGYYVLEHDFVGTRVALESEVVYTTDGQYGRLARRFQWKERAAAFDRWMMDEAESAERELLRADVLESYKRRRKVRDRVDAAVMKSLDHVHRILGRIKLADDAEPDDPKLLPKSIDVRNLAMAIEKLVNATKQMNEELGPLPLDRIHHTPLDPEEAEAIMVALANVALKREQAVLAGTEERDALPAPEPDPEFNVNGNGFHDPDYDSGSN